MDVAHVESPMICFSARDFLPTIFYGSKNDLALVPLEQSFTQKPYGPLRTFENEIKKNVLNYKFTLVTVLRLARIVYQQRANKEFNIGPTTSVLFEWPKKVYSFV